MLVHESSSRLVNATSADNAKRLGAADYGVPLEPAPIFLRVNTAGVLSMLMANGETVNEDVLAGEVLSISPAQILSPATTAVVTAYW